MAFMLGSALSFYILIVILPFSSGQQLASTPGIKIWNAINNFTDPACWKEGKLPGKCDRVIIPQQAAISVFLQSDLEIRELVLPVNGDIVLASGTTVTIKDKYSRCTDGGDVHFVPPMSSQWFDPNAWNVAWDETAKTKIPVPELERVPCYLDDVIYPFNSSYHTSIIGYPVHINSLSVAGKNLSTDDFVNLLNTPSGKLHFFRSTTVAVHNTTCNHLGGCPCGNDDPDVLEYVCGFSRCKAVDCADPIKPVGSCCPICGSLLTVNCKSDFEFHKLHKLYSSYLAKPEYSTVKGYVSRIIGNNVQAVFVDEKETHRAGSLAAVLANYLNKDIAEVNVYGIATVSLITSSAWFAHELSGLSPGQMMGVVALFMFFVYLIFGVTVVYKKYGLDVLTFGILTGRLHQRLDEEKDDSDDDEKEVPSIAPQSDTKGFENPMYEETKSDTQKENPFFDVSVVEEKEFTVSTEMRENPMFNEFEDFNEESLLK